jgi:GT2 family glycosyltransferase
MTSYEDFVADDHVVTAVTFACAMCRKEVFTKLGGLEEAWLPNGFGDVDLGLRAIRAGYRNFYLGSVQGLHHESKTRKDFCEDLEQVILYERNTDLIQTQMLRQLGYDTFAGLQTGASWFAKPLRYRLADRANNLLKAVLGPFHRRLRSKWKQLEANLGPAK